jgi:hypothetical protein
MYFLTAKLATSFLTDTLQKMFMVTGFPAGHTVKTGIA